MDDEQKAQIDQIYRSIGEFTVLFSTACFYMEEGCKYMHELKNGTEFGDYGHVAGELAENYKAYLKECLKEIVNSKQNKKIINKYFKIIDQLVTDRNNILHGIHFVGYASEPNGDCSEVMTIRHPRASSTTKIINNTISSLEDLASRAKEFARLSTTMYLFIISYSTEPQKFDLGNYFKVDNTGKLKTTSKVGLSGD